MTAQIKMTRKEAEVQMACFRQTFSSVRLLNEKAVLQVPRTHSKRTELECRVLHEKRQLTTLDVTPQRAEQIFARYIEVDGEPCVLELVQDLQQDTPEARGAAPTDAHPDRQHGRKALPRRADRAV